jgi:hypothetical protein
MKPKFGGAVALVGVMASLSGCSGTASTTGAPVTSAALGREVQDGTFAFTVTRFASHLNRVDDHTAQGQFVAVIMTVKNVGNDPQTYVGANQKLTDVAGNVYSSDGVVEAAVNDDQSLVNIKPGTQIQVESVFDVPPGTAPASVELHDSALSAGAIVHLDA